MGNNDKPLGMSGGVPAGWVLVPVEPTREMTRAAFTAWMTDSEQNDMCAAIYRDMLAATPTPPIEGRDADVERDREVLREAVKAASVAEVCAILATRYDSKGNAQVANGLAPTAHRVSRAYEQHLVAIRAALQALEPPHAD